MDKEFSEIKERKGDKQIISPQKSVLTKSHIAFTMAEAVLVMTILGIIVTVMITTIKPARFKEQGYKVLAKSVYASIDTAISEILTDRAPFNKLDKIYKSGSSTDTFNMADANEGGEFIKLLKDYMVTARGSVPWVCNKVGGYNASILLKNGACIAVKSGTTWQEFGSSHKKTKIDSWIPGENSSSPFYLSHGYMFVDINGQDEPNVLGTDQFIIPLTINGIADDQVGNNLPPCENDQGIEGCAVAQAITGSRGRYIDDSCTVSTPTYRCKTCCGGYIMENQNIRTYTPRQYGCGYEVTLSVSICHD